MASRPRRKNDSARSRDAALRTLGLVAGTMAHELRNLLLPLATHAELALRSTDPKRHRAALELIAQIAQSACHVAQSALGLVSPTVETTTVGADAVRRVGELFGVKVVGMDTVCLVPLPAAELQQIVANLIMNAKRATGNDSRVTVHIERCKGIGSPRRSGWVSERREWVRSPTAEWLRVTVADDGIGMTRAQARALVHGVSYRTNRTTGSGFGMRVIRQLVERSGGGLAVQSRAGKGTEVSVWLPVVSGRPTAKAA